MASAPAAHPGALAPGAAAPGAAAPGAVATGAATVSLEALELFAEVLGRSETDAESGERFYDHLCEAVCRLARMRRAIIFRYDPASRRVRAAGSHRLDLAQFAGAHVTVDSAPIAARALASDAVVEATGAVEGEVPAGFSSYFDGPVRLFCVPMTAAGRSIGVILADRVLGSPPLDDAERHLLWSLGKGAALASVARIVATQAEQARGLESRLDLAREIHEGVIQRLFGVSMALDGDGELPGAERVRCAEETQAALLELRSALGRPLGRAPRATATAFAEELERLAAAHPELGLAFTAVSGRSVPPELEPLAQSVLREAIRNVEKHARATRVAVTLGAENGAVVLDIVNDGVAGGGVDDVPMRAGMGLRLAAFEALSQGGVVEYGARAPGDWGVRLVVGSGG